MDPHPTHPFACPPSLRILVLQQGRRVGCSGETALLRLGEAWFAEDRAAGIMTGPYPDVATLFAAQGRPFAVGPGGQVLEWSGLVASRDDDGEVAGPYDGLDEWMWDQAEMVSREVGPTGTCMSFGGRYIHHWRGLYFVTVDPLPARDHIFPSLEQARDELRALSYMALRLQHG